MLRIIKKIIRKTQYQLLDIFYDEQQVIKVDWYAGSNNFGDVLNSLLLHKLTGKKIVPIKALYYAKNHFFVIGSILSRATRYTTVWGTGFISEDSHCQEKPLKVLAVRGPKTRQILLNDGIDCPKVYGDPALLLPKIYYPKIIKKYKLGIVPHYVDKNNEWLSTVKNNPEIKILNIQESSPFIFIDELLSCEKIASSSLHGVIVADAYAIPSVWIDFSNEVMGNGFKFLDYFASVKRKDEEPLVITENTKLSDIYNKFYDYKIDIDLNKLLKTCPFKIINELS